jgi:hypothetical protein
MSDDPAKARFFALQAIRFGGVAITIVGALIIARKIDLPQEAGYAIFLVGVLDALFMPRLLARRWKSPPP